MESKLHQLHELLTRFGMFNDGVNHGSEYEIMELADSESLKTALDNYFSGLSTSSSAAQSPDAWSIRIQQITNADEVLRIAVRHWFYEQEFSPSADISEVNKTISDFLAKLHRLAGDDASVFKVEVSPPMWYGCHWQDFAFEGGDKRWLLHFGFSD